MLLNPYSLQETNHATTALIIHEDNRRILMRMDDRAPLWGLAGGGNLDGKNPAREESYIATIHQEVTEEICTRVERLSFAGETWAPMRIGGYNHERIYAARLATDAPAPLLGDEGASIAWFYFDELPKNTTPRVRKRIEAYFYPHRKKPFSLVYDETVQGRHRFAKEVYSWNTADITGLDVWLESERVQQKIATQSCFDPFNDVSVFEEYRKNLKLA